MSLFSAVKKILPGGRKKQEQEDEFLVGETLDGVDADFLVNLQNTQQVQPQRPATPAPQPTQGPIQPAHEEAPAPFIPDTAPKPESPQPVAQPSAVEVWDDELNMEEPTQKKTGLGGLFARFRHKQPAPNKQQARQPAKPKKQKTGAKPPAGKVMLQIILLVVLFFALGFMAYRVLFPHHGQSPQPQALTQVADEDNDFDSTFRLGENDPLFQNPFVEIGQLDSAGTDANGNKVLAMNQSKNKGGSHATASPEGSYQTGALPAIPGSYPRPSLPAIPQAGSIPAPSTPPAAAPKPSQQGGASVQGVLTGEDGNNMAIMSDGTVLSEGESYRDGRIAYIGGDGIHFDNGNTIPYGNQ